MSPREVDALPPVVAVSRTYGNASADTAYAAWTKPTSLERWFGPPGFRAKVLTHELHTGGRWRLRMEGSDGARVHHFGTFTDVSPGRALAFTWASEEQVVGWRDEHGNPTLVTVTFEPVGSGVKVTIVHRGLCEEPARLSLTRGWQGSLDCLSEFLGGGEL